MSKKLRVLAVLLSAMIIAGAFAGCGSNKKNTTDGSYTYWVAMDTSVGQTRKDFSELLMYQELEKRSGIKIDFIHPAQGTTGSEAFQILLASGDYPDMIEYNWGTYTGGPAQAIEDGVIIALNDYLEEYAPNYNYYMNGEGGKENNYSYRYDSVTRGGNYYGFKSLNIGSYSGFDGLYVRGDLLEKWGLDVPVTIADWEEIFKTAKENGVKYPITGISWNLFGAYTSNGFNGAWGVGNDFYLEDGKIKFGPFEPEYKDYVVKVAEWMKLGYIDPDFVTNDNTIVHGNITNGTSIAARGFIGGDLGAIVPAMLERDPEFELVACPYPVMKEGDVPKFQSTMNDATDPSIAISVQCGEEDENRYKEAIGWCDYLYSEEGLILKCFGIEGDTFTIEKGEDGMDHYIYTDKVKKYEEFGATNMSAALYHYMLPANHPGLNQHPDYFNGYYEHQIQKDAVEVWNKYVDEGKKHALPSMEFTADEAGKKATIEAAVRKDLQAAISNIMLGKASIDTYDAAIKEAKADGYDELLKIMQTAYERKLETVKNSK